MNEITTWILSTSLERKLNKVQKYFRNSEQSTTAMTHSLKLERRCTYCYLRVSLDVWQKQCDYTLELKGSQNVSKSCPDSRNSSSYLHDPFLNSPKNHQFFWATFVSNFVRVNFQKLPDLVTLDRRLNR